MEYKVILVGDGGVGKTSLVKRLQKLDVNKTYIPTMGAEVHPLVYNTNYGEVFIKLWDTAGQENFTGLKEGYYIQSNAGIIMCDSTSEKSVSNMKIWERDIYRVCPNLPRILVCNKSDIKNRVIGEYPNMIDISAITGEGVDELIVQLLRLVTKKSDLQIL